MSVKPRQAMGELLCLALLFTVGGIVVIGAARLPEPLFDPLGPAGLPRYVGWLLIALAALRLVTLLRAPAPAEASRPGNDDRSPRAVILPTLITLAYVVGLTVGGIPFPLITLAFLFAFGAVLSDKNPLSLLIVAAIAVIASFGLTYVFTDVLTIILPE